MSPYNNSAYASYPTSHLSSPRLPNWPLSRVCLLRWLRRPASKLHVECSWFRNAPPAFSRDVQRRTCPVSCLQLLIVYGASQGLFSASAYSLLASLSGRWALNIPLSKVIDPGWYLQLNATDLSSSICGTTKNLSSLIGCIHQNLISLVVALWPNINSNVQPAATPEISLY